MFSSSRQAWKQDSWEQEEVIHKTVSINPISPNFTNIKSFPSAAGGAEDHGWHCRHRVLSFSGSLSSVCAGFMTFVFLSDTAAVPVGGVFCLSFIIYFHFGISRPRESRYKFVSGLCVQESNLLAEEQTGVTEKGGSTMADVTPPLPCGSCCVWLLLLCTQETSSRRLMCGKRGPQLVVLLSAV